MSAVWELQVRPYQGESSNPTGMWAWWRDCWQGLFAAEPQAAVGLRTTPANGLAAHRLGAPRYRHPRSGQSWDGHGRQPQWLRDALLCEGYTVDALRRAASR